MLGDVNKLLFFKSLLTMPSNVLHLHLKQTLPPIIWIFTEGVGIESKIPFKIFSTLCKYIDFDKCFYLVGKKPGKVDCNEECAKLERNRRVALALQIENPDMSAKLVGPKYSEFLKELAKKDPSFCGMVHDKLTELVNLAKESKHKSR